MTQKSNSLYCECKFLYTHETEISSTCQFSFWKTIRQKISFFAWLILKLF